MKITIVGCGIIGVSTGVRLLENFPDYDVTIVSDKFSPDTTTDVAAGFWWPYAIDLNDPRIVQWCKSTFHYLKDMIVQDNTHHHNGVFYIDAEMLEKHEDAEIGKIHEIVGNARFMNQTELLKYPGYKSGVICTSIMAEGKKIVPYLMSRFKELGGKIQEKKVTNFDQLQQEQGSDIIVNCCGLQSQQLTSDNGLYPIRGQIVKLWAPWCKKAVLSDKHYIFPQSDGHVVCGGTKQKNNWNTMPDQEDTQNILYNCYKLVPGLKSCKVVGSLVGLRPGRSQVKLEPKMCKNTSNGSTYKLIHNYGHGGAGLTLFWGCAQYVVDEVKKPINLHAKL